MSRPNCTGSILFVLLTGCASAAVPERGAVTEPEPAPSAQAAAEPQPEPAPEPVAATTSEPAPAPAPEPVAAAEPEAVTPSADAEPAKEPVGTLLARKGKTVRIKVEDASSAAVDQYARLLRYFEGKSGTATPLGALAGIFGGNATVSGWLAVADVRVQKIEGNTLTLEIEREQANIVMNGKKVNHFTPGAKVKLSPEPAER